GSQAIRALAPFGKLRPSTRNHYLVALYQKELFSLVSSRSRRRRSSRGRLERQRIDEQKACLLSGTRSLSRKGRTVDPRQELACRASGPRLLTAKAVRKCRWLYRAKNILRIGGYDARCGGSIRLAAAGMDWSSRHGPHRSEEHTSELQSRFDLVCRLLLEKKKIE